MEYSNLDHELYARAMSGAGTAFEKLARLVEMKKDRAIHAAEQRGVPTVWAETVAQYLSDRWVETAPVAAIANHIYWNWRKQEGI